MGYQALNRTSAFSCPVLSTCPAETQDGVPSSYVQSFSWNVVGPMGCPKDKTDSPFRVQARGVRLIEAVMLDP